MKYKRLAVFVENKKGDFYYVVLSQNEMDMVANLISQIHNGIIKVGKEKYPFKFLLPQEKKGDK